MADEYELNAEIDCLNQRIMRLESEAQKLEGEVRRRDERIAILLGPNPMPHFLPPAETRVALRVFYWAVERLTLGLEEYGEWDPAKDKRDLRCGKEMREEAVDLVVYAAMGAEREAAE